MLRARASAKHPTLWPAACRRLHSFPRRGPLHCTHSMRPLPDGWNERIQVFAHDLPSGISPVRTALARWVGGTPCRSGAGRTGILKT